MPVLRIGDIELYHEYRGNGPRLLVLWGTGADLRRPLSNFDRQLAGQFAVLTLDQRGMGRSGKPDRPYTMADYADDARGLLDAAGWDRVPVLGYSFGGMVAQELALRCPERVERLVLMSTTAGGAGGSSFPMHELADLPDEQRAARFLELSDTRRTKQWQSTHPVLWHQLLDDALASMRLGADDPARQTGSARQLEARRHHDTWNRLPQLRLPVSVFAGRHDGVAPPDAQQQLAGRIPGAVYRDFDGGHLFVLQDPAATGAVIDALSTRNRECLPVGA